MAHTIWTIDYNLKATPTFHKAPKSNLACRFILLYSNMLLSGFPIDTRRVRNERLQCLYIGQNLTQRKDIVESQL